MQGAHAGGGACPADLTLQEATSMADTFALLQTGQSDLASDTELGGSKTNERICFPLTKQTQVASLTLRSEEPPRNMPL